MIIHSFILGPMRTNCYVLAEKRTNTAVVIDPGPDPAEPLAYAARFRFTVTHVLLTHLHIDHIHGVAEVVRATGARVLASPLDAYLRELPIGFKGAWGIGPVEDFVPEDLFPGKMALVNEPCIVLDTPGHTPGGVSYHFPVSGAVFTGDSLFRSNVGRCDFPGGDADLLLAKIRDRLLCLPDDTEVYPGHGPISEIGREKAENPFFAPGG